MLDSVAPSISRPPLHAYLRSQRWSDTGCFPSFGARRIAKAPVQRIAHLGGLPRPGHTAEAAGLDCLALGASFGSSAQDRKDSGECFDSRRSSHRFIINPRVGFELTALASN
jgi:hypothetical protein